MASRRTCPGSTTIPYYVVDAVVYAPFGCYPGSVPGLSDETGEGGGDADANGEQDPLYDEAVRIVTESRRASVSGVQRRLKIGYNRAARLVESMEAAGLVGPLQSNGSREVLAPPPPES